MPSKNHVAIYILLIILFPNAIDSLVDSIHRDYWYRAAMVIIALPLLLYALHKRQFKVRKLEDPITP
jgi:hypothetical protein